MQAYQHHPPAAPAAFCETPTASEIRDAIDMARQYGFVAAIYGAPGIGKTTALRHVADTTGAAYAVQSPARSALPRMLASIAEAIGEPAGAAGQAVLHQRIVDSLRVYPCPALLIDEAQHLPAAALDELRCIHDESGVPLVVAGNEGLRVRVAALPQLESRIGVSVTLRTSRTDDVTALARCYGIVDEAALAWLATRGRRSLRILERLMRMARDVAGDGPITVESLELAAAGRGGAA